MPLRPRLTLKSGQRSEAANGDPVDSPQDPHDASRDTHDLFDGIQLELEQLRQTLRPLLEVLPAEDLIRMGVAASRGERVTLGDASVGRLVDGQIKLVLLEELHAVLADRGIKPSGK
jgi:hypothetical protein